MTKKGFTLIELLVVVAIIGILAAVGTPIFQGFLLDAKITATREKHQQVVSFISSGWLKCSSGSSFLAMKSNPTTIGKFKCSWVMADTHRWTTILQYHFQLMDYKNPYDTSLHNSYSVSKTSSSSVPCRSGGIPNYNGKDNLGGTCLTLNGNSLKVTSNIGDITGNSKYIINNIILE
jgi:type IV pilus assembly protein PilA